MAFPIVRETRKGWERYKLDGYDRFLMERDMLNPRPWMGRRHIARACGYRGWASNFRWRGFVDPTE